MQPIDIECVKTRQMSKAAFIDDTYNIAGRDIREKQLRPFSKKLNRFLCLVGTERTTIMSACFICGSERNLYPSTLTGAFYSNTYTHIVIMFFNPILCMA
jgi:hypothetical protein